MAEAPVIFVHGITGANMLQTYDDSFDTVWSGMQKIFESIWDLELDPTGTVDRDPRDLIVPGRIEWLAYAELLSRLRKEFKAPIYIFRYDWRRDNAATALKLGEFLDSVRLKTGADELRIITHSMGALVLGALLKQREELISRIARCVMAAPPLLGAAEAVRALIVGQSGILPINSSDAFRKIARSFPSVYQLVPCYPGAFLHHLDEYRDGDVWNLRFWQRRVKFGSRDRTIYQKRHETMQRHLTRAGEFHRIEIVDFDTLPAQSRGRFMVLYGTGEKTLEKITVLPANTAGDIANFFKFDDPANFGDGDGTVPLASAKRFHRLFSHEIKLANQRKWWNPFSWEDSLKIGLAGFHGGFLALDKVQSVVVAFLKGQRPKPSWSDPIRE